MRSFEAPAARPTPPRSEQTLALASFFFLFGAATQGCEMVDRSVPHPERPLTMREQIKQHGIPRSIHDVADLAIPRHETATAALEFDTAQVTGDWRGLTNAGRFNQAFRDRYRIAASTELPLVPNTPEAVNHIIIPFDAADSQAFDNHKVRLTYRFTRTEVFNTALHNPDQACRTEIATQQVLARPFDEVLEPSDAAGRTEKHLVGRTYSEALGQIFYTLVLPPEGQTDMTMHEMEAESRQNSTQFNGETCGRITTEGTGDSIYCQREVHAETDIIVDSIRQNRTAEGLINVSLIYHPIRLNAPATPGR